MEPIWYTVYSLPDRYWSLQNHVLWCGTESISARERAAPGGRAGAAIRGPRVAAMPMAMAPPVIAPQPSVPLIEPEVTLEPELALVPPHLQAAAPTTSAVVAAAPVPSAAAGAAWRTRARPISSQTRSPSAKAKADAAIQGRTPLMASAAAPVKHKAKSLADTMAAMKVQ